MKGHIGKLILISLCGFALSQVYAADAVSTDANEANHPHHHDQKNHVHSEAHYTNKHHQNDVDQNAAPAAAAPAEVQSQS